MGQRREARVHLNQPATLCGMDAQGRPFLESVIIHNISGRGALVEARRAIISPGDAVVLRCGANKGRFKAMWVAQASQRTGRHLLGLQHLLPTTLPWGLEFPLPSADEYTRPRLLPRRQYRRFSCELAVELRIKQSSTPIWTSTNDVSEGGCFLYMLNVLPISTLVDIAIWVGQVKVWIPGTVVSNVNGFGVGIKFIELSSEARYWVHQAIEGTLESPDRRFVDEEILEAERFATSARSTGRNQSSGV